MSNRPNVIGFKNSFKNSLSRVLLDTTISAAIDSPTTNIDVYPQAYTATVAEGKDTRVVYTLDILTDIVAASRVAFGLFLPDLQATKGRVLYNCRGAIKFGVESSGPLQAYPIFGQCANSTVTSSTAAAANQLAKYMVLPANIGPAANSSNYFGSVNEEIFKEVDGSTNPLCFAWVIENNSAAAAFSLLYMQLSLTFQQYTADDPMYTTLAR